MQLFEYSVAMQTFYYVVFLACVLVQESHQESSVPAPFPVGDVRNCPVQCSPGTDCDPLPVDVFGMEVMPGAGFDNLRNIDMGHVHFHNYSSCKLSNDGKYLLPDNVFLFPRHGTTVDRLSTFIDHWNKYTSLTASSINTHSGPFPFVGRTYSHDYMSVKSRMYNDDTITARVEVRHLLYKVQLAQDSQLHPGFKSRLFEIIAHLQNNNTDLVHYLAELIVRDYGTHYVTSMDAGAVMSQTDHIQSNYSSNSSITSLVSANFYRKFFSGHIYANMSVDINTDDYESELKYSTFCTHGGPPFETYSDWQQGIADALVAIDRSGEPLHFAITPSSLPEIPETTVQELSEILFSAIHRYYKVNTREGCTDRSSENFNFQANLDDGSCKPPVTNLSFGGVYQKCSVDPKFNTEDLCTGGPNPAQQVNPLTDDFSCPENYVAIKLHTGKVTHVTQKGVDHKECHNCHWLLRCCKYVSVLTSFVSQATYEAYWCAALPGTEVPENSGYLFGGVYTSSTNNPVTGAKSCPHYFYPLHMGEDIQVCVSSDYEQGAENSVPFAGFDSCLVGNPLAADRSSTHNQSDVILPASANWPHTCPHGYAQHLVAVDEGCEINFCVHVESFKAETLLPARLPPFRKHPKHKVNVTNTLVVSGLYGDTWMKNEDGMWTKEIFGSQSGADLLRALGNIPGNSSPSNNTEPVGNSGGLWVALFSVIGSVLLGAIIIILVFVGCYAYKQRKTAKQKRQSGYTQLNDPPITLNPIN